MLITFSKFTIIVWLTDSANSFLRPLTNLLYDGFVPMLTTIKKRKPSHTDTMNYNKTSKMRLLHCLSLSKFIKTCLKLVTLKS